MPAILRTNTFLGTPLSSSFIKTYFLILTIECKEARLPTSTLIGSFINLSTATLWVSA
jgi:hypothetical protein